MKKSDLKTGMLVKIDKLTWGIVDLKTNTINCYFNPQRPDPYKQIIPLSIENHLIELDNWKIAYGGVVKEKSKDKYPEKYKNYNIGDFVPLGDIISLYDLKEELWIL